MTLSGAVEKHHLPTNITLFFYGNKKYSKEGGVVRRSHLQILIHVLICSSLMYSVFFEYMSDEQMST